MQTFSATVAITGMNARPDNPGPGLAVARCLRESPWFSGRIVGLSYDALDPGMYLREYCDSAWMLPFPSRSSTEYLHRLKEIHQQENFSILIPCLDVELPGLSRASGTLADLGISTFLPGNRQLQMRNKDRLPELAELANIHCPRSELVSDIGFFRHCEQKGWNWPLIIKGIFYDAEIARNREQAEQAFKHISSRWGFPLIIQEMVIGEEYNLAALGDGNGRLLSPIMMRKLAVTDKGKAWAGITIADKVLLEAGERLAATLNWRGPLEVEVIRDKQGRYFLIEINPRFPAWIYLSVGAGNNLPESLLRLVSGMPVESGAPAAAGIMYLRYAYETLAPIAKFESLVVNGHLALDGEDHW